MSNLTLRMTTGFIVTLALLVSFAGSAWAQEDGKRVMILKFDTLDVDTEVMDTFYTELNDSIEDHKDKVIVPGGEVSLNDMVLTVGCEGPTPECLSQLQDFVEADQLLFGSVQRADDVHLFTVRLFDFETQSFEAEIVDQTVDGDMDRVSEVIPALVDGLLYGEIGVLEVNIYGAEDVDIFLDGEKIGKSSTVMENLPLGEHVLMVRSSDGEEQTKQVLLERDKPSSATFTFGGGAVEPVEGGGNTLLYSGVGLAAVGVVGIGVGAAQYIGHRNDAEAMNDLTVCTDPVGESPTSSACNNRAFRSDSSAADRSGYAELEASKDRKYRNSLIGFGLGGLLTAAGGALIYMGTKNSETALDQDTHKPLRERVKVQFVTTPEYQGVQFGGTF